MTTGDGPMGLWGWNIACDPVSSRCNSLMLLCASGEPPLLLLLLLCTHIPDVCSPQIRHHGPSSANSVLTTLHGEPTHKVLEEGLGREVGVVLLSQRSLNVDNLQRAQLKAAPLESGDDLSDQTTLWRGVAEVGALRRQSSVMRPTCTPSGLIMI